MRDRMEKLVVLPFTAGCISQASLDVIALPNHHHLPHPRSRRSSNTKTTKIRDDDDEESMSSAESIKNSFTRNLPIPKTNISTSFHRLLKTFKNISQLFEYKDDDDDDDDGIEEMDIEIGFPTDVKHVSHIGFDGSAASTPTWDTLIAQTQHHLLSLPAPS